MIPALLVPLFIFINMIILKNYAITLPETTITLLVAGVLSGFGYSMIYRQGYGASVIFLLEDINKRKTRIHSRLYSWFIDIILIIILLAISNYRIAIYSLIIIMITKYMITKARFCINESFVLFLILTVGVFGVPSYIYDVGLIVAFSIVLLVIVNLLLVPIIKL